MRAIFNMYKCEICGREIEYTCSIKGYKVCNKHYQQFIRNNKFLDKRPITTTDPNIIRLEDNYAVIELRNSKQIVVAETLIDIADIETVSTYKWRWVSPRGIKNTGNFIVTGNGKETPTLQLHRLITNCPSNLEVDHVNGNRLDNRKVNLRVCTRQENQLNVPKLSNNTSGFKGVWFDKDREKWVAEITYKKTKVSLGRFHVYEKSCYARFVAETILHGEFRNLESQIEDLLISKEDKEIIFNNVQEKLKTKSLIQ